MFFSIFGNICGFVGLDFLMGLSLLELDIMLGEVRMVFMVWKSKNCVDERFLLGFK